MISEQAEEILETLWVQAEEQGKKPLDRGAFRDETAIEELLKLGYIRVDQGHVMLLEKGRSRALGCVRRHRLAERLMTDMFDVKKKSIEEVSCRFEHLLHEGLEDKVCAILGHPKMCPHGKPISPGKCCARKSDARTLRMVAALSELEVRDRGPIAYLQAQDASQMQKLLSIGAIPGVSITLLQTFPSYVFKIGESQFAIDKELAGAIYVRLAKP